MTLRSFDCGQCIMWPKFNPPGSCSTYETLKCMLLPSFHRQEWMWALHICSCLWCPCLFPSSSMYELPLHLPVATGGTLSLFWEPSASLHLLAMANKEMISMCRSHHMCYRHVKKVRVLVCFLCTIGEWCITNLNRLFHHQLCVKELEFQWHSIVALAINANQISAAQDKDEDFWKMAHEDILILCLSPKQLIST